MKSLQVLHILFSKQHRRLYADNSTGLDVFLLEVRAVPNVNEQNVVIGHITT